jgi:acyl-CoA synthetase (AMP-forming)/AMP-acid ligase II
MPLGARPIQAVSREPACVRTALLLAFTAWEAKIGTLVGSTLGNSAMVTLSSFIQFHARRTPDRVALAYGENRITYAELMRRIETTAGWLAARGIKPGDVIALLMKNSPAFLELTFATSHLGAISLPINYRLAAEEVDYILDHAGARLLLCDHEFAAGRADLPSVLCVDTAAQSDSTRLARAEQPPAAMWRARPEDLFRLMYTSGTTERPKGVMHSYANFYWKCADHVVALGLSANDRLLIAGPLYHVGAFDLPGAAVLWVGGTLAILRDFSPEHALAAIAHGQLSGAWLAPVMLGSMLAHSDRAANDLASVRWVVGGGERTPEARIRAFGGLFTRGRYVDAYGLTETCSGDTMMEAGREIEKIGSVGRPLAHIEVEIRGPEGQRLATGEAGEICLRGPKVTQGYWKDPEKTKASFFGDWFRTGDVGHLDAEGFLYLTDRKKDMIVSGGENIASSEVERVVYELPQIQDAAVIGVPDRKWGERPVAVVVLKPGQTLTLEALQDYCRRKLAGFKVPKELIVRPDLPRNPSGKILKRLLRQDFTAPGNG